MNGIDDPEITPGVSAGSRCCDSITSRTKGAVRYALYSRSVKTQKRVDSIRPFLRGQQVTNATQVPRTLFTYSTNKQDRTFGLYTTELQRTSNCNHRGETTAVIGNTWSPQFTGLVSNRAI